MIVLGTPGAHARRLAHAAWARAGLAWAAAAVAAAIALGWPGPFPSLPTSPLHLAAVAVAVVASRLADHWRGPARRAAVGARSERRVARQLRRVRGLEAVVHGALLGAGGDADHVLLGPVCAVIETKTGHGPLRVLADGRLRAGARVIPGDPIAQARRQASALGRRCGTAATAIVCVPDATDVPAHPVDGVHLCSLATLGATLMRLDRPLAKAPALERARELHAGRDAVARTVSVRR